MENEGIIFSFLGSDELFEFQNGFSFVKNEKILNILRNENFKNEESSLIIKSSNNIKINEVFQLKINIKHVGYFLVNFPLEENVKEKYLPLIKEIECLKESAIDEKEKQLLKIEKVISILNKFKPLLHILLLPFSKKSIYNKMIKNMSKYNETISGEYITFWSEERFANPFDYYFPLKKVSFGDTEIPIPNNYEEILKKQYGNYKELPPEEKRVSHSPYIFKL